MSAIKGLFWYLEALFDNMAINMNGKKPLQIMMMDYSIHKASFLNFIAQHSF